MTPTERSEKSGSELRSNAAYFGWTHIGADQFEKDGRKLDLSATAEDRVSVAYAIALQT